MAKTKDHIAPDVMPSDVLPPSGYSIAEIEKILQLPHRVGYHHIKDGRLKAFRDVTGKLKVTPEDLWHYMKSNNLVK